MFSFVSSAPKHHNLCWQQEWLKSNNDLMISKSSVSSFSSGCWLRYKAHQARCQFSDRFLHLSGAVAKNRKKSFPKSIFAVWRQPCTCNWNFLILENARSSMFNLYINEVEHFCKCNHLSPMYMLSCEARY